MTHVKEQNSNFDIATFAGGCFWCMESAFAQTTGVVEVISGLTGGDADPGNYQEVHAYPKGHVEAVKIVFDPKQISYQELLDIYWHQIDPTDIGGQFVDRGSLYTTVIFYHTPKQQQLALASKQQLQQSGVFDKPIVTKILPAKEFYKAEEYHQGYYAKYPQRYQLYRAGSGRDEFLQNHWGEQSKHR